MDIKVTKTDVAWGYVAIIFQSASGLIVLPFILSMLSPEEVGFNYLMLTIGTIMSLFDASFSPMFGKNISYVFSGAQKLKKEGVIESHSDTISYHLLATLLGVAKMVYRRLSITVLFVMLTFGSIYIYYVTNGFKTIDNSILIWAVFSISTFFNLYFSYYNALLEGAGQITEMKKAIIANRLVYIIISIVLLYCGIGLLGVCIANLLSPFVGRYISYRFFFKKDRLSLLIKENITRKEIIDTFKILWYNVRKISISMIGSYCITNFGMFISGLYLPLNQVASYGLMVQVCSLVTSISQNYYLTKQPMLASFKIKNKIEDFKNLFSFSMTIFLLMMSFGLLSVAFLGPVLLALFHSHTSLPTFSMILFYSLVIILEANHSLCSLTIMVGNRVVPIAASIIPGIFIVLLNFLFFEFTNLGIWGVVLAPALCQIAYNNWKWPTVVLKELQMSPIDFITIGVSQLKSKIFSNGRYIFSKL